MQSLEQIKDNDILIYADIGCSFDIGGKNKLKEMIDEIDINEIMGVSSPTRDKVKPSSFKGCYGNTIFVNNFDEKTWSKADIFAHFNVLGNKDIMDSPQIASGFIFMKKTPKTIKIMQEWRNIFYNYFNLVDDSTSKIPNDKNFMENRHDQSIWSVLNKINKLKNFKNSYPIIASRNKIFLDKNDFKFHPNNVIKILKLLSRIYPTRQGRVYIRKILHIIKYF
ncbi:MAG: hypothetical protein K2P17_05090 [Helicobacteraceae bacterium]|nr:hypothetical protein [Helicobacteraceae bacterium]